MLDVQHAGDPACTHIRLLGQLTSATAPQLDTALAGLLTQGARRWLLDLGQLAFCSSAGLRVFLTYAKRIKNAGGRLVFCGLQPAVREVFEASGFTQILMVVENPEEGRRLVAAG